MPWSLFTGRRGDSDSRSPRAPDASLTHPLSSMRGLLRRASGGIGEFVNPSHEVSMPYSKVSASSIAGMCENAIRSSEFQSSVLMMGWLCRISNLACWKQGHSLSK